MNIIRSAFFFVLLSCVCFTGHKPIEVSSAEQVVAVPVRFHTQQGRLVNVEDSGYPMATLTITFPGQKGEKQYSANLEELKSTNAHHLEKWKGKTVSFTYISETSPSLLDIRVKGKSILNPDNEALPQSLKKISGTLMGARQETAGDLPDVISIKGVNKSILKFETFITTDMVKANGKLVVGFYEYRTENTVQSIKLASR